MADFNFHNPHWLTLLCIVYYHSILSSSMTCMKRYFNGCASMCVISIMVICATFEQKEHLCMTPQHVCEIERDINEYNILICMPQYT